MANGAFDHHWNGCAPHRILNANQCIVCSSARNCTLCNLSNGIKDLVRSILFVLIFALHKCSSFGDWQLPQEHAIVN